MSFANTIHEKLTSRVEPIRLDTSMNPTATLVTLARVLKVQPILRLHFISCLCRADPGGAPAPRLSVYQTLAAKLASRVHALALTTLAPTQPKSGAPTR